MHNINENSKQSSTWEAFILIFLILFAFWYLLSTYVDTFHLGSGFICSVIVAYMSRNLMFVGAHGNRLTQTARFIVYIPWLLYQIVIANIDVAKRILSPDMPIDPRVVTFKSSLKSDLAKTTLANSITLTPGTVTIDIKDDVFYIHAISESSANDLLEGTMQRKVAHVFMED
ncbi:MAG TPA: cation transporter [Methanosarcinaceae archaeon]|nr:cation transporter [Methanosarcinaceae archaeon]